jgi:hypothetical protein
MEKDTQTGKKMVVLYTWPLPSGSFKPIPDEAMQISTFSLPDPIPNPWNLAIPTREILLGDVKDFQVTARLSNLYFNRIRYAKYADNAIVRLYVQLGGEADLQYSNDLIFANKSIYGDVDGTFFISFDHNRIES